MKSLKKKIHLLNNTILFLFFFFFRFTICQEIKEVFEQEEVTLHDPCEVNKYYFSLLPPVVNKQILDFRKNSSLEFTLSFKIKSLLKKNHMSDAAYWGSFNVTLYDNALFNEAFGEGNIFCAQLYLARKKDPLALEGEYTQSPLNLALFANHSQVSCILLERGADPNQKDYEFSPYPICKAAQNNDPVCVRLLLEKGATKGLEDALQWGARKNSTEIVRLLLEKGTDPNKIDSGLTAFVEAARNQNVVMAQLLLAYGAQINPTCYHLRYALQHALIKKNELVPILQNAGVKVP